MELPTYYDFPRCREAFARGQKDARLVHRGGCWYRLRGRTRDAWTLLGWEDPVEAWGDTQELAARGGRVGVVGSKWSPLPGVPTRPAPVEWIASDFPAALAAAGPRAQALRRATRACGAVGAPSRGEAFRIFDEWAAWAKERHFMVFTGHYRRWVEMFYEDSGPTTLEGIMLQGELEGIFGFERMGGVVQVTVAKHTPRLTGRQLWVAGLLAIGPGATVLCGSTADKLKHDLGLAPRKTWTLDVKKETETCRPSM